MRKDKVITEMLGGDNVITPSDLYHHQFKRVAIGGYKPDDVDAYLERVADVMEGLINQARDLKQRHEDQRERLDEYRQMEETLRDALVSSQQFGENILDAAKRQAEALIEEARARKAQIEVEAARLPNELAQKVQLLRYQREQLRCEILAILETHRRLLDDPIPPEEAGGPPFAAVTVEETVPQTDEVSESYGQEDAPVGMVAAIEGYTNAQDAAVVDAAQDKE